MKTTLNIPEDLIKTAMSLSKISTKTETVVVALREYIRKKKVEKILGQEGSWNSMTHGEKPTCQIKSLLIRLFGSNFSGKNDPLFPKRLRRI